MMVSDQAGSGPLPPRPLVIPLGDGALLVRFSTTLSARANIAATQFARRLAAAPPAGVEEIVPNLVSVLVRYDHRQVSAGRLAGDLAIVLSASAAEHPAAARAYRIGVSFGGADGPDLASVADQLGLGVEAFVSLHNQATLRVLATGFAPGFVYCGFHRPSLHIDRRKTVRPPVPAGSILFAAGQTAITATSVPTGWHVIGRTGFRNFDAGHDPPTTLQAGDAVHFEAQPQAT